ncbi:CGNR zinc finger domain-containing protein [Amycolatopsis magusensis]|uniref:RNA-binding Zn ribbon-like protein n=1 Tax=Amycolatopsis magusensis TaxID=882444 RepID=A0ABS4PPZ2_9PSEU|nr:ABATE domain-containing protein [Amycolatopsis magusensis]MBP2181491.1 putative RNA-binding Zn ribbon-like protein [Amycolatopsis magusensis]
MFPLLGEPLALDLVNTRDSTGELLPTTGALAAWLDAQAGRLTAAPASEAALEAVIGIRAHIATAVEEARHGRRPPVSALRALTEAQRAAPAYRELTWDGSTVVASPRRDGDRVARLVAELAEAAADLLGSDSVTRVTNCEAEDCLLLFLPAHPRRRWCSPAVCGNRARVARYYQKHKN